MLARLHAHSGRLGLYDSQCALLSRYPSCLAGRPLTDIGSGAGESEMITMVCIRSRPRQLIAHKKLRIGNNKSCVVYKMKGTTMQISELRKFLTLAEVADHLGGKCNKKTVAALIRAGRLKGKKVAREWRVLPDWLDEFMHQPDNIDNSSQS